MSISQSRREIYNSIKFYLLEKSEKKELEIKTI